MKLMAARENPKLVPDSIIFETNGARDRRAVILDDGRKYQTRHRFDEAPTHPVELPDAGGGPRGPLSPNAVPPDEEARGEHR